MGKKYSNAASEYDNTIEPSKKKGGLLSSLKSKLSDALNTISGGAFGKLNSLKSGLLSFDLSALTSKLKGLLTSFLDNSISMLKDMAKDALTSLKNAGKNFAMNIVEQFYNDIKAMLFIPDKVFCKTIEALYIGGADLAYNNHYLRKMALSRDWNYTLKYVDKQYKTVYSLEYSKLEEDLSSAAKNGCYKNIGYMFDSMLTYRNQVSSELALTNNSIASLVYDETKQKALKNTAETLTKNRNKYDELIVKYTKMIIVYGYSSFSTSRVKSLIKSTNGIVLPKYFGETDDKYSKRYAFSSSDCKRMMPDYSPTLSNTDKKTLQEIDEQNQESYEEADELKEQAQLEQEAGEQLANASSFFKNNGADSSVTSVLDQQASYLKTNSKIKEWRSKYQKKLTSQNKALSKTALTSGVKKVTEDNRARYHKNYDGSTVKYRDSLADKIDKFGNIVGDGYISLRNKYIKAIYIMLSSKEIYGSNRMVNQTFYSRCKMKTANTLMSSLNKSLGLLGASSLVQAIYDVSDVIDGSAYNYTKKVEKWLYDPKSNVDISAQVNTFGSMFYDSDVNNVVFTVEDDETNTITNTSDMAAVIKNPNSSVVPSSDMTVSNDDVYDELDEKMSQNSGAKKRLLDITRYVDKIPIGTKRDILVKYMTWFYDNIQVRGISKTVAGECLAKLVYNIFGRSGFTSTGNLDSLFTNTTNENLNKNLKIFISISILELANTYLVLDKYDSTTAGEISDIYDMAAYSFAMEIKSVSFAKAVFLYDNDYMKTLAKQKYESEIKQLKELNTPNDDKKYSNFYPTKDSMTLNYDGFDRFGIFGFDERTGISLKYTNVITGDWNSILSGSEGTFFGGSDFTKNNGIRYLDEDSDTIKKTSITSGTWNIIERSNKTFFINTAGDLYTWNSDKKNVEKILTKEANKYDFIEFAEYGLIIANGTNNNGLMKFNGTSFDKLSTTGSNFKYFKEKNYLVFYTNEGISKVIAIDVTTGNVVYLTNESYSLTTPIRFDETHTITTTITTTSTGSSGTSTPTTTTTVTNKYKHHILFGRLDNGGVYDCVNINETKNSYSASWEKDDTLSLTGSLYLVKLGSNINAIKSNSSKTDNENVYIIKLILSHSYSATGSSTSSSESSVDLEAGYDKVSSTHQYTEASNFSLVNDTLFFKASYLMDSTNNTWETRFFVHNYSDSQMYQMSLSNKDSTYFYNPNSKNLTLIFGKDKSSNIYYYYDISNHTIKELFDDKKYLVNDIKYIHINRKYAQLYSESGKFGVVLYNNDSNSIVKTNLTTNQYKVLEGNRYYYALSQNGTNKGVLYSKKPNFDFIDVQEGEVNRYDIPAFYYDSNLKRIYLGVNRANDVLNVDNIKFDIDEFVYLNNSYQLYKAMESNGNDLTDSILSETSMKLGGVDPSKIIALTSEELEKGPISGKEYFVTDETTGNLISVGNSLDNFDSNENYYSENKSTKETNSFNRVTPEEKAKGPNVNTTYYKKDVSTGRLVSVGIVTKFDDSIDYFTKNEVVKEEKYVVLTDSDIANGPVEDTEYFVKNNADYVSVGNELTSFDSSKTYYKEVNPIDGVPIFSFNKVLSSEIAIGPIVNIEYYIKTNNGEYISVGNIDKFEEDTNYYTRTENRSSEPYISSSMVEITSEEFTNGPITNKNYYIKDSETGKYSLIGIGNDDLLDFDAGIRYYIIRESEIITAATKTTVDILNELTETWDSYMQSMSEIEKSSPFYSDLASLSEANEEFDIDDPNESNGIILDMILGDEGKSSTAYLLLEDNDKKYYISNEDEKFKNLKPGTSSWNMANEYTSTDFLNSDEDDYENLTKS